MLLSKLINDIQVIQISGNPEQLEINNLTINSNDATVGAIFIAIEGYKTDGHNFISHAVSKGASAIVLEKDDSNIDHLLSSNNVVKIVVKNSRQTLPILANILYNYPSRKLNLIGITGTKGKTTTSYFIKNIFELAGIKSGLIGTNINMIGEKKIPTKLTTPEAHITNKLMSEMVHEGCENCIMEVSSHSLELLRVEGLDFNVGVFTNITSDHLDFHENFENYLNAKKLFFDKLNSNAYVVYNKDDNSYEKLINDCNAKNVSYAYYTHADIKISNVKYSLEGTEFEINYNDKNYPVRTKLIGLFNAYNATAAIASAIYSNIKIEEAIEGINRTPQVPGRFEVISSGNKKVIVDYSHTTDSLQQALQAIRHIVKNDRQVNTVFGCGGDRDKSKRPMMGKVAEEFSDVVYVTSDNPRSEEPKLIINDIDKGMTKNKHVIIVDREEAIRNAIDKSEDDAVILIAGKGHENYQEINGNRNYFSDKEVAQKYL